MRIRSYNKALLQVVGDIEINVKTDAPSIIKKIVEGEDEVDSNNVGYGETVNYIIKSAVPDMTHYNQYYFIIHDKMSIGLTYTPDSMTVSLGEKTLTLGTKEDDGSVSSGGDYYVEITGDGQSSETIFTIVFNDFIQYKEQTGAEIKVTYSATLNEYARVGATGNPNEVKLEYSNDPNEEGEGEDIPGDDDDVTGETPWDRVITYTTGIKINKVDDDGNALTGATFTLSGISTSKSVVTTYSYTYVDANIQDYESIAKY